MSLPWVRVCPDAPYFCLEDGAAWTPIGQNDGIEWPELHSLFRRRDPRPAREYFQLLARSGVTVLRLMLEYCHHDHRYLEKPAGRFQPAMVRLWDDIFQLCEEYGLRLLLTPFDTFWMWRRWKSHPYNRKNGGPCPAREQFFLDEATREAVKVRLRFVSDRWGASGAIFAWDLWNELHPSYGCDSIKAAAEFVTAIGDDLRKSEMRRYGRAHPQTVSTFLPLAQQRPELARAICGHPHLDFASTHFYEEGTIDAPRDTVCAAVSTGRLVRELLNQIAPGKPFFDSEHGPIHTFKDHRRTLPESFDNEYFRHIQWAHFASGGAGGGMRWPNRKPHSLTGGMREAQRSLANFLPLIDWTTFSRRNWNDEIQLISGSGERVFGCGDKRQAIVWILRNGPFRKGLLLPASESSVELILPWKDGRITGRGWDTERGIASGTLPEVRQQGSSISIVTPAFRSDLALALYRECPV